jgi:ABC-type phosphate/phosphonate transport system substrate-binding protein
MSLTHPLVAYPCLLLALTLNCAVADTRLAHAKPVAARAAETQTPRTALVLTAAPRETAEAAAALYEPLARYLGEQLGRPVEYRHVGDWGVYQTQMVRGEYDLVFDGPHFNAYRIEKLRHELLVKLPGTFQFAIIARENPSFVFKGIQRMYGRRFCALAPPNLGTLILFSLFENPLRQPVVLAKPDFASVYDGVLNGSCEAGVIPLTQLRQLDHQGKTRILYFSSEIPNQALSAGPRVNADERRQIVAALTSTGGQAVTEKLRATWGSRASGFVAAGSEEYTDLAGFLRHQWGFY